MSWLTYSALKEHEQEFIHTATECNNQAMKKALSHQRKELEKAEARLSELSLLFRKLYEGNALGRLSNEQFVFLTSGYEDEKATGIAAPTKADDTIRNDSRGLAVSKPLPLGRYTIREV